MTDAQLMLFPIWALPEPRPGTGIAELPLSQGEAAIVYGYDFDWASQWDWFINSQGHAYRRDADGETYLLHRVLTGADSSQLVRFRNGNKLDCRRFNLEIVESIPLSDLPKYDPAAGSTRFRTTDGRFIVIDACYASWVRQWEWYFDGRMVVRHTGNSEYLHRILAGANSNQVVTFANGNRLDYRRSNLRVAPKSRSGIRGVSWSRQSGKWQVSLTADGQQYHGGFYDDPLEAAAEYDRLARELHGEDAITNDLHTLTPELIERLETASAA